MKPPTLTLFISVNFFTHATFVLCDNIFGDWEDPHDIYGKSKSSCGTEFNTCQEDLHHCKNELYSLRDENQCKGPRIVHKPSVADHYLKRFINVLLSSTNFKDRELGEGNEIRINLNLYYNAKTLPVLQAFASDDRNGYSWSDLDAAFVSVFSGDSNFRTNYASDFSSSVPSRFSGNPLTIIIAIVGSTAFCTIWIFIIGRSFKSAFFVGSVLIVSFCFGWTWWSEIEIQKLKFAAELSKTIGDEIPDSCKNPSSSFWSIFSSSNSEEECLKYWKARDGQPIVHVDPAQVFSKTLQTLVFSWLPALAKSASESIDLFYGRTWFGTFVGSIARITTGPVLVILIVLSLAVIMITRSSFRFKNLFFDLEYGSKNDRQSLPAQEQTRYEQLPAAPQLRSIENGSHYSPDVKKVKRLSTKIRRPKLQRSDTISLPLTINWPLPASIAKSRSSRQVSPFEAITSKQRSEEKRFRELRRAHSSVECALLHEDLT